MPAPPEDPDRFTDPLAARHALLVRLTAELSATESLSEVFESTARVLTDPELGYREAGVYATDPATGALRLRAGVEIDPASDETVEATLFDRDRRVGEIRVRARSRGAERPPDQAFLDAVARVAGMAFNRARLEAVSGEASAYPWIAGASAGRVDRTRTTAPELPADTLSEVYFGGEEDSRSVRWAAVFAIVAHFAAFLLIFPDFSRDLPDLTRDMVIIQRYKPPPPKEVERRPERRKATRVPIPDPTPDDIEPIEVDELDELPPTPPDIEYIAEMPDSAPMPPSWLDALAIETAGLMPPRVKHRVQPRYDRERARRGIQGTCDLQIVIDTMGRVGFARVLNGTGDEELDRLAVEAVQQWEFTPAIYDSSPVAVRAVVTISFRIY